MSDTLCLVCTTRPRKGRSYLCGGDFVRLRVELATVQDAHRWLGVAMNASGAGPNTGVVRHAADSKPPYRLDFTDARQDIEAKLASWAQMIGEERFPPVAGPPRGDICAVGTWLHEQLPWVSDQAWVDEFLRELVELRRAAYQLAPWDRTRRDVPLPCSECGLLSLALFGASDFVVCRNRTCGNSMTVAEYRIQVSELHRRFSQSGTGSAK